MLDGASALLSPVGALLNHSCYPTTCVAYDSDGRQCFIACAPSTRETKLHILMWTAALPGGAATRLRSIYATARVER